MNDYTFVGADFTVVLDTGIDLTPYTLYVIYRKPNSATEYTVSATAFDATSVTIDITSATNDTEGKWLFRAYLVNGAIKYYGEPIVIVVKDSWYPFF